jgi:hypothetical protein
VCLVVESDAGRMTGRLGWRHFVGEDRRILNFVIQTELLFMPVLVAPLFASFPVI